MKNSILISSVKTILERDLNKAIQEINAYHQDETLWEVKGEIKNSSGNLAIHIAGAIHHFIGKVLGENGYIRDRDREFSDKNLSVSEIIARLTQAIEVVKDVLESLKEEDLDKEFPEKIGGNTLSVGFFLIHLVSHVNYHLGQINYNRRLREKV
jgi:uncharacterized damage-inducible protein DinB